MSETATDLPRIRRNVEKMIGMGAPAPEIDAYLGSEGFTPEKFRSSMIEPRQPPPESFLRQQARAFGVAGRGLAEGAAGLLAPLYDAASVPVNLALSGIDAAAGTNLPRVRSASQNVGSVLDAAGAPTPQNGPERLTYNIANMAGGAAVPMLGPVNRAIGAVAPTVARFFSTAPGAQLAGAAGAGVAQTAAQSAGLPEWAEVPAAVAGGVLGAGAVPAVQAAGSGVAALVRPWTREGVQEAAGTALLRGATDPRRVEGALTQPRPAYVARSAPTTAEVVNDPGLLQLERTLRSADPSRGGQFALRDAQRDAARATSANMIETAPTGAEDVNRSVQSTLAQTRQAAAAAEQAATQRAAADVAALGDRVDPTQAGTVIRREFDSAYRGARGATREAYQGVGDLEVPLRPIGQRAFSLTEQVYGPGGGDPPAALRTMLDEIRATEGNRVPFDWWQRFRSRAAAEASAAGRAGDNRAAMVFGEIRQAADDALDAAAQAGRTASPEQAERLSAAQGLRREQAARFETGAADQVRRTEYGRPVLAPSVIPGAFFRPGDGGREGARQFIAAVGDSTQAREAMRGFVVDRVLASATRPDGSVDPSALMRIQARYRGALQEFPDLARGIANAENATRLLAEARAQGARSVEDAERGVAAFFLNNDPQRAVERVMTSGSRVQDMRDLVRLVHQDEAAMSGLRRAFIDAWQAKVTTTAPDAVGSMKLSPAQAERFWRDQADVARVLFRPEDVSMFENITRDFASGNRVNTVNRAIGSNTFQNTTTAMVLGQITGGTVDPVQMERALGGVATKLLRLFYGGAEQQAQDLIYRAMLEPEVARALVAKATPRNLGIVTAYLERSGKDRLRAIAADVGGQIAPAAINAGVQSNN